MGIIIARLAESAGQRSDQVAVQHLVRLRKLLNASQSEESPDWDELAGRWLDVIRPVWFDMLKRPRRKKPLLIRDVRQELLSRDKWLTKQILENFRTLPSLQRPEERVQACIVGVPV
jgi:hypothetical protein